MTSGRAIRLKVHEPAADETAHIAVVTLDSGAEVERRVWNRSDVEALQAEFGLPDRAVVYGGESFHVLRD